MSFEPSYLLFGAAVAVVIVFYFLFVRRRREEDSVKEVTDQMRQGIGDALTGKGAKDEDFPDDNQVHEDKASQGEAPSTARVTLAPLPKEPVPVEQEPTFSELPAVSLTRPEPAECIRPLAVDTGRKSPDFDPMLDTFVRFTPREGFFTTDRLVQVPACIDKSQLTSIVTADFFDSAKAIWSESFRGNETCSALIIRMQLAHRGVTADELLVSRFLQLSNQIAIELDAEVEQSDIEEILEKAQKLSNLIARFDNSLTLFVKTQGAYDSEKLQAAMRRNGFERRDVRYVKCAPGATEPFLSVVPQIDDATRIAFELDIPMCDPALRPLAFLFEVANDVCAVLDASLVDGADNPIASAAASYIDGEFTKLFQEMDAQGIAPGTRRCIRLFRRQ